MIQKLNSKMIRQMHFMYMGKFLFHLGIDIQKSREKVWITFNDTTVSGMRQSVLHCFRGFRGRGRPSILTRNPKSLHVSDCNVLTSSGGAATSGMWVSLRQLLFKNFWQASWERPIFTYYNNRAQQGHYSRIYGIHTGTYSTVTLAEWRQSLKRRHITQSLL